ncbi:MAG: DUF4872 domain-containing protein, partial [Actinomycetota bacterium]|nr:DUF4872 domain-containing protein [Actinomycetota bacterium]
TVYLDDVCVRPNSLSRQDFLAAWTGKHRLLTVTGQARHDLGAAIRDAVRTTVGHLTGPVLGHAYDVNFGLSGMSRLAVALGDRKGRKGWSTLFGEPSAFFWGLRRLHDCLELDYTAPGATRPLYADFLTEAAAAVADESYLRGAEVYRECGPPVVGDRGLRALRDACDAPVRRTRGAAVGAVDHRRRRGGYGYRRIGHGDVRAAGEVRGRGCECGRPKRGTGRPARTGNRRCGPRTGSRGDPSRIRALVELP